MIYSISNLLKTPPPQPTQKSKSPGQLYNRKRTHFYLNIQGGKIETEKIEMKSLRRERNSFLNKNSSI